MTVFYRSFLAIVLGVWAAPSPVAAADSALDPGIERTDLPAVRSASGPLAVFAAFEEAWLDEDTEALVELLDPQEKVNLSFTNGGPRGGYFNRAQAFYLLKDLLEFTQTDLFEFQKYWNLDSEGRSPYAVALREYRMNEGARHTDQVYISLRQRGDAWFVGEIRSIDR